MKNPEILLKKTWLKYAESAKVSADRWRKSRMQGWSKEDRQREADAYMKTYDKCMKQAAAAPIKIVMHYEDGRTEIIE